MRSALRESSLHHVDDMREENFVAALEDDTAESAEALKDVAAAPRNADLVSSKPVTKDDHVRSDATVGDNPKDMGNTTENAGK